MRTAAAYLMAQATIAVQLFEPFRGRLTRRWLQQVAHVALATAGAAGSVRLGVVVADDQTVQELNWKYRGLDEVTDVLAFSFLFPGEYQGSGEPATICGAVEFPRLPGEPSDLGEVILSYPRAVRQARAARRRVKEEVAHLVVHGVLHLLSYDHGVPEEERAMRAREDRALACLREAEALQ